MASSRIYHVYYGTDGMGYRELGHSNSVDNSVVETAKKLCKIGTPFGFAPDYPFLLSCPDKETGYLYMICCSSMNDFSNRQALFFHVLACSLDNVQQYGINAFSMYDAGKFVTNFKPGDDLNTEPILCEEQSFCPATAPFVLMLSENDKPVVLKANEPGRLVHSLLTDETVNCLKWAEFAYKELPGFNLYVLANPNLKSKDYVVRDANGRYLSSYEDITASDESSSDQSESETEVIAEELNPSSENAALAPSSEKPELDSSSENPELDTSSENAELDPSLKKSTENQKNNYFANFVSYAMILAFSLLISYVAIWIVNERNSFKSSIAELNNRIVELENNSIKKEEFNTSVKSIEGAIPKIESLNQRVSQIDTKIDEINPLKTSYETINSNLTVLKADLEKLKNNNQSYSSVILEIKLLDKLLDNNNNNSQQFKLVIDSNEQNPDNSNPNRYTIQLKNNRQDFYVDNNVNNILCRIVVDEQGGLQLYKVGLVKLYNFTQDANNGCYYLEFSTNLTLTITVIKLNK